MKKKLFISILVFTILLLISITCYANDMNLGNEMKESMDKTSESMQNAGNGAMEFANNIGNGVKDMAEGIGTGIQDMFDGDNPNTTTGSNYNASRTSADVTATNPGTSNAAWIWLILGITGIIIVALTWYYVSQDNDHYSRK